MAFGEVPARDFLENYVTGLHVKGQNYVWRTQ